MTNMSWMSPDYPADDYSGPPRNIAYIDQLDFDPALQPANYEIAGTSGSSKILILDVEILEATGREPYRGDVLILGVSLSHSMSSNSLFPYKKAWLTDILHRPKICLRWQCS